MIRCLIVKVLMTVPMSLLLLQTCPGRCEELRDCVQCRMFGTGEFEDEDQCQEECMNYPEPEPVDVASSDEENDEKYCAFTDQSDHCRFYFVYGYTPQNKLYIKAQRTKGLIQYTRKCFEISENIFLNQTRLTNSIRLPS